MNWKEEAKNDLSRLRSRQHALVNIPEQVAALREDMGGTRSSRTDAQPVQGGSSRYEDRLLNNIVKRDKLSKTYRIVHRQVKAAEDALSTLDSRQRRVLELFFVERQQGHIERLCEELSVERSQVYRLQEDALYRFTLALYGLTRV